MKVKDKVKSKVKFQTDEKFEVNWRVLLHNDDINTFDYVTLCLFESIKTLTRSKAHDCTVEAHCHNVATLAVCTKRSAENYCMNLQKKGLTVSIAPDSNFKKKGEVGQGDDNPFK